MRLETLILGLMFVVLVAALSIAAVLVSRKEVANPHDIPSLAKAGNRLARLYVALWAVNVVLVVLLIGKVVLSGR